MSIKITTSPYPNLALEFIRNICPDIKAVLTNDTFEYGVIRFLFSDEHVVTVPIDMTGPKDAATKIADACKQAVETHNNFCQKIK